MECHIKFIMRWRRKRRIDKKNGLQICNLLLASCNLVKEYKRSNEPSINDAVYLHIKQTSIMNGMLGSSK